MAMGLLESAGGRKPGGSDPWGHRRSSHAVLEGAPSPASGPTSLDPPKPVCCLQCHAVGGFQWTVFCIPVSLPHELADFLQNGKGKQIMVVWMQGKFRRGVREGRYSKQRKLNVQRHGCIESTWCIWELQVAGSTGRHLVEPVWICQ